jgi:hypothetical protein
MAPMSAAKPLLTIEQGPGFAERHYSVSEIAALWNLSADKVRRLFEDEPGVLVFGDAQPRYGRRRHRTLRIPESVAERVYRRMLRR